MRYEVQALPDWASAPNAARIEIARHHEFEADDPAAVVVIPEGMPTWLRMMRDDLEAVRGLAGSRLGHLRDAPTFARMVPVLDRLYAAGLLFVNGTTGIRVRPTSTMAHAAPGKPKSLLVKMTGACDIACDYCYDYDAERWKGRTDLALVRRLIRDSLVPGQRFTIMIHGGEPLLQFAAIRELVAFAEQQAQAIGADVRFTLQTNGLRLSREVVDFLCAHPFGVGISLDGPAHVHDLHRIDHRGRGTFERLAQKFDEFPDFMREHVGYISVATPRNIASLEDTWAFFRDMGVLTWKLLPSEPEGRGVDDREGADYIERFIAFLERRLDEIVDGRTDPPYILNITQLISPLLSTARRNMCMKMPCGAATDLLVVDAQNQLRACDCTYHPAFLLERDDVAADLVGAAMVAPNAQTLVRREAWLLETAECRHCPWLHFCAGTCPARALLRKGTLFAVDDLECATRKALFPKISAELARSESRLAEYYRRATSLTLSTSDLAHID